MSSRQSRVLFEHTWKDTYPWAASRVRTFRIVGVRHTDDDDRLSALHLEELYDDAMGYPAWHHTDRALEQALAKLLQMSGLLPAGEDLSCL